MDSNQHSQPPTAESPALGPRPCSEPLYVLEKRFKPGWYLEWWGDGEGGPYWTNDLAKAEKLTMKKALYEQGMLREVTLIVPNESSSATAEQQKGEANAD